MEPALAQRLSTLTQLTVVLAVIALLGALRRYDTVQLRNNVIALGALADTAKDLDPEHAPLDPAKLNQLASWLKKNAPDVDKRRLDARTKFSTWLKGALKPQQFDPARFTGKGTSTGTLPFFLEEIALAPQPAATDAAKRPAPPSTVASLLDRFETSSRPLVVRVVTSWDETMKAALAADSHGAVVTGVWLTNDAEGKDQIQIGFQGTANPTEQASGAFTVNVAATTELVAKAPTLLDLASLHQDALQILQNAAERSRLRQEYGSIPIVNAMSVVQDELSAAYRSVDVLGFSISPTHLPVAVLLVQLVIAALIHKTVTARGSSQHELKEVESAFYPLVQDRLWRAILWVVLPVLNVWITAAFEQVVLTSGVWPLVLLVPGSGALIVLGVRSWSKAEHGLRTGSHAEVPST